MRITRTKSGATAAAALLATMVAASPATAYGTGGFSVANSSMLSYGCFYHSYQVNLSLGLETTDWSYDVRVLAPNGSVFDFAYNYGTGGGAKNLPEEMFFCSSTDPIGTYTITGTLETYEGSSDYTPTTVSLVPASFQMSPYTPPPPPPYTPPPAPAPVTVQIDGTVASARYIKPLRKFTAVVQSEYRTPAANETGAPVKWVLKVGKKTVKSVAQSWSETDTLWTKLPRRDFPKTYRIRLLENGKSIIDRKVTVRP